MHWVPAGNAATLQINSTGCVGSWQDHSPKDIPTSNSGDPSEPVVIASFLTARKSQTLTTEEADLQKLLHAKFAIPQWLWQAKDQDANGYFYGASLQPLHGHQQRHVSVFRFMVKYVTGQTPNPESTLPSISYDWHILTFVIYTERSQKAVLLCINVPDALESSIEKSLRAQTAKQITAHPFALHSLVLEHVVELYDQAIWQFRDFVRLTEKHRPTISNPKPDYTAMHELSRHVMHSSEVLSTALNVMDNILSELDRVQQHLTNESDPAPSLRYHRSKLQYMSNRSSALEGRLKNEMALAFHITAQHAAEASTQLAQAAKIDSSTMKTISILGLVFLPGTFISAVFSMSFFNFTPGAPEEWQVSEMFWIYWVVAIPVTVVTVGVWFWWQKTPGPVNERHVHRV